MEFSTPKKPSQCEEVLKIPATPLLKKIGYGTGIAVYEFYRSPLRDKLRSPWAVKKLIKKENISIGMRLKQEADILRKLSHENVVGFRAFIADGKENILAMEECTTSLGDLIEERSENTEQPFPEKTIRKVASDIAEGLRYLHNEALLMHGDIKSYNILIKGDFAICKLCDFGVCLPIDKNGNLDTNKLNNNDSVEYMGTMAWNAPEVLVYPQVITFRADIYSYGLVIWEMLALIPPPLDDSFNTSVNDSLDNEERLVVRKRPDLPLDIDLEEEYNFVLEIYFICTEEELQKRPTAKDLCEIMENLCNNICSERN